MRAPFRYRLLGLGLLGLAGLATPAAAQNQSTQQQTNSTNQNAGTPQSGQTNGATTSTFSGTASVMTILSSSGQQYIPNGAFNTAGTQNGITTGAPGFRGSSGPFLISGSNTPTTGFNNGSTGFNNGSTGFNNAITNGAPAASSGYGGLYQAGPGGSANGSTFANNATQTSNPGFTTNGFTNAPSTANQFGSPLPYPSNQFGTGAQSPTNGNTGFNTSGFPATNATVGNNAANAVNQNTQQFLTQQYGFNGTVTTQPGAQPNGATGNGLNNFQINGSLPGNQAGTAQQTTGAVGTTGLTGVRR